MKAQRQSRKSFSASRFRDVSARSAHPNAAGMRSEAAAIWRKKCSRAPAYGLFHSHHSVTINADIALHHFLEMNFDGANGDARIASVRQNDWKDRTMKNAALLASATLAVFTAMTNAASAQRWVSSTGTATAGSPCTRAAPCATFQLAHDSTASGPLQIYCVDSGNFGPLLITKSISVDCSGVEADATKIVISQLGASGVARIRGVKLNGNTSSELYGIYATNAGSVFIENCFVTNFSSGFGIYIQSVNGFTMRVTISDTVAKGNSRGIALQTSPGTGGIRASIERSQISANTDGITGFGDTNGNETAPLSVVITDSIVSTNSGNGALLQSTSGRANVSMTFDRSSILGNLGAGIQTTASNTFALLTGTTVIANGTGLLPNSGFIISYGNNTLRGNVVEGAPTNVRKLE